MRDLGDLLANSLKRRIVIGCLSTGIGGVVMCCCLVLLPTVILPFYDTIATANNQTLTLAAVLGPGLLALVFLLVVPVAVTLWVTWQRARTLDAIFTPLGLTGRGYMLNGRHYLGQFGGREVDVYIYRGPTVEVRLRAATQTRVVVVPQGSLPAAAGSLLRQPPIALEPFTAYSADHAWARGLLCLSPAAQAVHTLMTTGADWAILRRVEIQAGEVILHLYRTRRTFFSSLELSSARAWLDALQTLAQTAESLPAPAVTAPPTGVTRQSREQVSKFQLYAVLFIVFVMPICMVLAAGALTYLLVSLK